MSKSSDMSTSNQHVKYYIEVVEGTQNIANNTSPVTVRVWFYRTNSYSTYGTGTVYCKIDGTQYSSSVTPSQAITSTPICLFEKTVTISHASNGSKTLTTSAWISHNAPLTSSEQSYSVALSTIPRASSISSVTSPVSVNGSNKITISISRKSSSFTHTVTIKFGSYSKTISGVATSTSYTIPVSWLDAIPNSDSGTGTITVQTKSGSTNIGSTVSKSFTVTVPADYIPTFTSVTATPINSGTIASWDAYIQGKSRCQLVISGASANHGATVKSYSITGGGFSTNLSNYTTSALPNFGDIVFEAKVIDSRGRSSAPQTVTIHVEPYEPPSFENVSTYRCNSEGGEDGHGSRVSCCANFVFSTCGGLNSATAKVYYRRSGTTGRSGEMTLQNGVALILGNTSYGEISEDYSWDIVYEISDAVNTSTTVVVIHTSFNTMDFKRGGKGVAFGKASEKENTVEISGDWTLYAPSIESESVSISGKVIADYIVEQGTSGNWTYRKWASGRAECHGVFSLALTNNNIWASPWYFVDLGAVNYPTGLFTAVPELWFVPAAYRSLEVVTHGATAGTKDKTPTLRMVRPSSFASSGTVANKSIAFRAVGRWK